MKIKLIAAAAIAALGFATSAQAHKAWLQPSQTVFSDKGAWLTVDAAVSNDLFYFNHVPLPLERLRITAPDGSAVQAQNASTGKLRSVFDVELAQEGTYKIAMVNEGMFASYKLGGEAKRWRGKAEDYKAGIPAGATEISASESLGRVETFATVGSPTTTVFKASGKGIELVPVTHPNDLFAGEKATFQLLVDGKPAAGLKIEVVPGATRYRDQQNEIHLTSGADGKFEVNWPQAGMYWLETASEDAKTTLPDAKQRRLSYVAVFEVLSQ
ncbi:MULTISPECIES: DUF4198 domain-containing protein [unclassified Lysobacter]|uniref:DUF4198 domain-containing protein n=1 Tax=unclassified Lysobacter TaxID=2635362 RepID=UPI0007018999|nr:MULTISPECIES: DUF4198 domain-containing protein [unclassified Lysobacter]KRA14656.1 ABC transporter permease [Lysobacter sp. Root604]KRD34396.1 ABC transporter permease [Lysobacter sp. Root916]KRD78695.1 ABC transporter permease [Lysobacter sp. Root983]